MGAPTENEFWKLRKDMTEDGRKLSVAQVVEKAQEYIDFCIENPLQEIDYRGKDMTMVELPKMRAMTLRGLYHWLVIDATTWAEWRDDKKYSHIIARIENLIYTYKFEGAAAGQLNPNIIARDLGLADKQEKEVTKVKKKVGFGKRGD